HQNVTCEPSVSFWLPMTNAPVEGNCPTIGGVMRPILFPPRSVNQTAPSGPPVIPQGELNDVGIAYSLKTPLVVTRPMLFAEFSVNQSAPSGPVGIPRGPLAEV